MTGTAIVLKYFIRLLYASEDACIMNITSEAGHLSPQGYNYLAYSVSKHAANMYTQKVRNYLAEEQTDRHMRIYMIHPGRMDTIMGKENARFRLPSQQQDCMTFWTGRNRYRIWMSPSSITGVSQCRTEVQDREEANMRNVNVGILGCGVISNTYIRDIKRFYPSLYLAVCADVNVELAKSHAEKYRIPVAALWRRCLPWRKWSWW